MILIILLISFIILINSYCFSFDNEINSNYLSRDCTSIINGFFIILIFLSHFFQYVNKLNAFDNFSFIIVSKFSQLMVASFLFYSGFGIYESIKNKKDYLANFGKNRFFKTWFNFILALLLYCLFNLIFNIKYNFSTYLLSFIGWESIGNSNWFMFVTFALYIIVILSFRFFSEKKALIFVSFLSLLLFIFLSIFKEYYWYNTLFCFSAGMWYSFFLNKVIQFSKGKSYYYHFLILVILFALIFSLNHLLNNAFLYNIYAIVFILIINLIMMKSRIKNDILIFCGNNVFWIYILQRIPMIVFNDSNYCPELYFVSCVLSTFLLTLVMSKVSKYFINKIFGV